MNTKKFLNVLLTTLLVLSFLGNYQDVAAGSNDTVDLYKVTVDPQPDGKLAMRYDFQNYCAATDFTDGPYLDIGVANSDYTIEGAGSDVNPSMVIGAETHNSFGTSQVRVSFEHSPKAGECFSFWFKIVQRSMANSDGTQVTFMFTPGWFSFLDVKHMQILWQVTDMSLLLQRTPEPTIVENYLSFDTFNLGANQKFNIQLVYDKAAFPNLPAESAQHATPSDSGEPITTPDGDVSGLWVLYLIILVVIVIIVVVYAAFGGLSDDGYTGTTYTPSYTSSRTSTRRSSRDDDDSGPLFGGGSSGGSIFGGSSGGGSYSGRGSSCACVSCACACACAGGGRAGCSQKDFYGTIYKIKLPVKFK